MAQAIRNPAQWLVEQAIAFSGHVRATTTELGGDAPVTADDVTIRELTFQDLRAALESGAKDFAACRTDVIFICVLYPIVGFLLAWLASNHDLLPMVFPIVSGFALLGPAAAVGVYEMSRRRERGEPVNWATALDVFQAPSFGAIVVLGLFLLVVFGVWILAADAIYAMTLGPEPPASLTGFARDVLTTGAGWTMIAVGVSVGFVFAAAVLALSIVSFPMLLDRPVGFPLAVLTSVRVTARNPRVAAAWGAIVAAALGVGFLPFLLGLIFVLPILGHATWHLYRRAVDIGGADAAADGGSA